MSIPANTTKNLSTLQKAENVQLKKLASLVNTIKQKVSQQTACGKQKPLKSRQMSRLSYHDYDKLHKSIGNYDMPAPLPNYSGQANTHPYAESHHRTQITKVTLPAGGYYVILPFVGAGRVNMMDAAVVNTVRKFTRKEQLEDVAASSGFVAQSIPLVNSLSSFNSADNGQIYAMSLPIGTEADLPARSQLLDGRINVKINVPYNGLCSVHTVSAREVHEVFGKSATVEKLNMLASSTDQTFVDPDFQPSIIKPFQATSRTLADLAVAKGITHTFSGTAGAAAKVSLNLRAEDGWYAIGELNPVSYTPGSTVSATHGFRPTNPSFAATYGYIYIQNSGTTPVDAYFDGQFCYAVIFPSGAETTVASQNPMLVSLKRTCDNLVPHERSKDSKLGWGVKIDTENGNPGHQDVHPVLKSLVEAGAEYLTKPANVEKIKNTLQTFADKIGDMNITKQITTHFPKALADLAHDAEVIMPAGVPFGQIAEAAAMIF